MPTAPVDNRGTVLYYEDSGVPDGSSQYLTVVLVHGLIFHGGIFRRLLPYASGHSLRLIFLNMRDYPGSTGFTQEELDALSHADLSIQGAAVRALGHELAVFVEHLIDTYDIPSISEAGGKRKGGIALLGWSFGNLVTIAMLAHADSLPTKSRDKLNSYLRTVVIYDPVCYGVGENPPAGVYYPFRDATLSLEQRRDLFCSWVSFYFVPVEDLDTLTEQSLAERKAVHDDNPGIDNLAPTVSRMTADEYKSTVDPAVFFRSHVKLRLVSQETYDDNMRRALFDTGDVWKDVNLLHVWCDMSMSDCVWAAKHVSSIILSQKPKRRVELVRIRGGNHFAHWDSPAAFLELLVDRL